MTRRLAITAALALGACTTERVILDDGALPIEDCDGVWQRGANGFPCDFAGTCVREAPPDPMCCTSFAYCRMGELVLDVACNPDCAPCADDSACEYGAATCDGQACVPCTVTNPDGSMCPTCPPGWAPLTRNGCATCQCAPPNECDLGGGMMCDPIDPTNGVCYAGANQIDGCVPGDAGCAANVCSRAGCQEPAPLGCFMDCMGMPCQQCASTACECDGSQWVCQPICIDATPVSLPCAI